MYPELKPIFDDEQELKQFLAKEYAPRGKQPSEQEFNELKKAIKYYKKWEADL